MGKNLGQGTRWVERLNKKAGVQPKVIKIIKCIMHTQEPGGPVYIFDQQVYFLKIELPFLVNHRRPI